MRMVKPDRKIVESFCDAFKRDLLYFMYDEKSGVEFGSDNEEDTIRGFAELTINNLISDGWIDEKDDDFKMI